MKYLQMVMAGALAGLALGCGGVDTVEFLSDGEDAELQEPPTWEAFLADATHVEEDGHTYYVVEGDVPVRDEQELREIYERLVEGEGDKSIVRTDGAGGADVVWLNGDQLDLTYCVAPASAWPSVGSQTSAQVYDLTKLYMQDATLAWQSVANVRYRYVASQESVCAGGNTGVRINVVPGSAFACSTLPYDHVSCTDRSIAINYTASGFPLTYAERLPIFLHELGHTLGLEHEHWAAPPDSTPGCQGSTSFRRLEGTTTFDQVSVMAYSCAGLTPGQTISFLDGRGIRSLYGAPPAWAPAYNGAHYL
jgi:hypothetical protein